jgi:hypothetical protein
MASASTPSGVARIQSASCVCISVRRRDAFARHHAAMANMAIAHALLEGLDVFNCAWPADEPNGPRRATTMK